MLRRDNGIRDWNSVRMVLPARMESAEVTLRLIVDDADARYPLTIDPSVQQACLKAPNSANSDQFGWPVSLSGDIAVVGAPQESSNATGVNGNQADNSANQAGAACG